MKSFTTCRFVPGRLTPVAGILLVAFLLEACGGGGGTGVAVSPMVDSFGNAAEAGFAGGGDGGAAGADGSAGDGAPIANAPVRITDSAGHTVDGITDANGVYHLRIDGFVPPLVAQVTRADGTVWYSPAVSPPVARKFVNISISGLTDYVAYQAAVASNLPSSALLTPTALKNNPAALTLARDALKNLLQTQLLSRMQAAGLDPSKFDPVTTLLVTNGKDYDQLLDSLRISNTNGPTTIEPLYSVSGSVTWQSGAACVDSVSTTDFKLCTATLSLNNGNQVRVDYPSNLFRFTKHLPAQANYSVSVVGTGCTVSNGQGVMASSDQANVNLVCR